MTDQFQYVENFKELDINVELEVGHNTINQSGF